MMSLEFFDHEMMSVMMAQASSIEKQIAALAKAVETLAAYDQAQMTQLKKLQDMYERVEKSRSITNLQEPVHVTKETKSQEVGEMHVIKEAVSKEVLETSKISSENIQASVDGLIHAEQLKNLIMGAIAKKDTSKSQAF